MCVFSTWRWHLDEDFVKANGQRRYFRRAVDHEGEVLEAVVAEQHDKAAALKFLEKLIMAAPRVHILNIY